VIALDSSSLIAYLSGSKGGDVDAVEFALRQKQAVLPPVVLSELLSDPKLPPATAEAFKGMDHDVPLLTRDADFRSFGHAGLKLLPF